MYLTLLKIEQNSNDLKQKKQKQQKLQKIRLKFG